MSSSIAAIHSLSKKLGLDDDTRRAKMVVLTGKPSTKDMTEDERQRVVVALKAEAGQIAKSGSRAKQLTGKYAKKLQALWIAGYNLGVVKDRRDSALLKFVKRQADVDHTQFLHDPTDGQAAVEGLKGWLKEKAGVRFGSTNGYEWLQRDGAKIAWAQWRILHPGAGLISREGFDREAIPSLRPARCPVA